MAAKTRTDPLAAETNLSVSLIIILLAPYFSLFYKEIPKSAKW